MSSTPRTGIAAILISVLVLSGCAKKGSTTTGKAAASPLETAEERNPGGSQLKWTGVTTPYPAAEITAVGRVFWICGADEMIASSSDGGNSWKVRHAAANGRILLHIAFVNEKVGHAAGKDGVLLSTTDGGKTWHSHGAGDDFQAFSFADARHGIAVIGGDNDSVTYRPSTGGVAPFDGAVKLTRDGGDHWEEIPALGSEELRSFNRTVAVAALDAAHFLIIRRKVGIEDVFVVTSDGGKSWRLAHQRNDQTNRELASWVFGHGGEYWAFGMELLHREKGGGYGFPLAEHSKDGMSWVHGVNGGKEFGGCNSRRLLYVGWSS